MGGTSFCFFTDEAEGGAMMPLVEGQPLGGSKRTFTAVSGLHCFASGLACVAASVTAAAFELQDLNLEAAFALRAPALLGAAVETGGCPGAAAVAEAFFRSFSCKASNAATSSDSVIGAGPVQTALAGGGFIFLRSSFKVSCAVSSLFDMAGWSD